MLKPVYAGPKSYVNLILTGIGPNVFCGIFPQRVLDIRAEQPVLTFGSMSRFPACTELRSLLKDMEISLEDYLMFVDRALDGMIGIVEEMGDDLANSRPNLKEANSPYAILFHCIGVCHYWVGTLVAGRHTDRDRPAEFIATGSVADLKKLVSALKIQMRTDLNSVAADHTLAIMPNPDYTPLPGYAQWTQGAVLIHLHEELAQHHGQMELTRDILLKSGF